MRNANLWLGAIWLSEHGIEVSASQFCALAQTAYSSAWTILQRVSFVLAAEGSVDCEQVPSSAFSELICKRSRETPARAHPFAEEAAFEAETKVGTAGTRENDFSPGPVDGNPGSERSAFVDETTASSDVSQTPPEKSNHDRQDLDLLSLLSDKEQQVHDCLSEEPLHFDSLCARMHMLPGDLSAALVVLELAHKAVCLPGDWYVRAARDHRPEILCDSPVLRSDIADRAACINQNFADSVRKIFHGISRKYLQPYLARDWCHVDRMRWCKDAVVRACLQFGPISYSEILDYVTPATVKVFACSS